MTDTHASALAVESLLRLVRGRPRVPVFFGGTNSPVNYGYPTENVDGIPLAVKACDRLVCEDAYLNGMQCAEFLVVQENTVASYQMGRDFEEWPTCSYCKAMLDAALLGERMPYKGEHWDGKHNHLDDDVKYPPKKGGDKK